MSFPAEGAIRGDGRTESTDSSLAAPGRSEVQQAQRVPSSLSQARHDPQVGRPRALHTPKSVPTCDDVPASENTHLHTRDAAPRRESTVTTASRWPSWLCLPRRDQPIEVVHVVEHLADYAAIG